MKVENGDAVVYDFDWYPAKAQSNLRKHGVSFRLATTVFRDPLAITLYDENHSDDEDRWVTLGHAETKTHRRRAHMALGRFRRGQGSDHLPSPSGPR